MAEAASLIEWVQTASPWELLGYATVAILGARRAIDGVEHTYSQPQDDRIMVTARFLVGTQSDVQHTAHGQRLHVLDRRFDLQDASAPTLPMIWKRPLFHDERLKCVRRE